MNLTTAGVKALKGKSDRYEVRDHSTTGLYPTVFPSGARSWILRFRGKDKRPVKMTLGPWDDGQFTGELQQGMPLSLSNARQLANQILRRRAFGEDVTAKKEKPDLFADLVQDFLDQHASRTRSYQRTQRTLAGLAKAWADRPLSSITDQDVFQVCQDARVRPILGLEGKEGPSEPRQRRFQAAVSTLFSWGYRNRRISVRIPPTAFLL